MGARPRTVGLVGGGVIGAGWAARFALNGVDVRLFDVDPESPRKTAEVMANARRAYGKLTMTPLPSEGSVTHVGSISEAVSGADFVQESAPERIELKQRLLAEADEHAAPHVVIASSTSGLLPSDLQRDMTHPGRLVVGHPFNPVYLMPLVEICSGTATEPSAAERAAEVYTSLGMHPLRLSREIDGFVADRLMEALWREALWLVHDGVATAEEIDDAVRFGPGLRWAFMGTFLTYRIAGGEAGMRHFMAQFGPALKWPWTKLMDVPELTDDLLERIVEQSDAQAAGIGVRELEALRDDCLVAVMQALRGADYGAGRVLAEYERSLIGRAEVPLLDDVPLTVLERRVPADWVDYNGHTNDSRYAQLASEACDAFFRAIGFDDAYLASGRTFFTVENHVRFLAQTRQGDRLTVRVRLVHHDAKRIHLWTEIVREDGVVAATSEQMFLHVDTTSERTSPMGDRLAAELERLAVHHGALPTPEGLGRRVGERP